MIIMEIKVMETTILMAMSSLGNDDDFSAQL